MILGGHSLGPFVCSSASVWPTGRIPSPRLTLLSLSSCIGFIAWCRLPVGLLVDLCPFVAFARLCFAWPSLPFFLLASGCISQLSLYLRFSCHSGARPCTTPQLVPSLLRSLRMLPLITSGVVLVFFHSVLSSSRCTAYSCPTRPHRLSGLFLLSVSPAARSCHGSPSGPCSDLTQYGPLARSHATARPRLLRCNSCLPCIGCVAPVALRPHFRAGRLVFQLF